MKIKFNHAGVWVIGAFTIVPGINDVPGFEKHMSHPDVKEKMTTKNKEGHPFLEIITPAKGDSEAPKSTVGIAGLKEKQALEMVAGCLNEKDLTAWQADEKRPKVLKAIEEQLKKFAVGHRKDEEEEKKEA